MGTKGSLRSSSTSLLMTLRRRKTSSSSTEWHCLYTNLSNKFPTSTPDWSWTEMRPFGFIALHHVLPELMTRSDGDGEIVDVVIEPLEESAGRQALQSQELRTRRHTESRKRRQTEEVS